MKKILALFVAVLLIVASMSVAFADENSQHVITINNTDQNVPHTYEAYQVFVGKLDATQTKLSDVQWGSGVDGAALLTALKNDATYGSYFTNCDSAAKVAEVLGANPFVSTSAADASAGAIDAIAAIIAGNLTTTKVAFTANDTTYTATVTGDGYYFVKDTTTTLKGANGSDTLSKYLLSVVKNVNIAAKDTHLTPDKEIVEGSARVKEGSAAVGDTVTFEVTIPVPNTKKYVDHFIFDMKDTLPVGMTFMGITSVKVGTDNVPNTVTVAAAGTDTYAAYTAPADAAAAVTAAGGQKIKVVFNNFKANAEEHGWIGQNLVVTYTAVVNDDADFTPTGNINEVYFDYSNDPNHDYDGDEPGPNEPMGETPHDRTKALLINLEVYKTGNNAGALEGAEFEITSTDYNVTLVTGEKYEASGYQAKAGETIAADTYYKLNDGSYTTTAPTDGTRSMYAEGTFVKVSFADANTTPGSTNKVTAISGADGKIVLKGLKPGTYTVKETKAPSGFNLDPTEYIIKIDWTYDATAKTGSFSKDNQNSTESFAWDGTVATAKITIDNKSGSTLPSTGGIGTTILYVGGSILVLAAVILLVTKRRMNAED